MHNIAVAEAGMNRAQEGVDERFQVLGANRRQPNNLYSPVVAIARGEVTSAISGDMMTHFRESGANFLVTGFDSAVFPDHASAADECNANVLRLAGPGFAQRK